MHKHHILPKYKGGTNDPTNLIEVSVTCHSMFHFCNWQLWGDTRDYLAWKGLAGVIGKEEIVATLARESGGLERMWKRNSYLMKNDLEFAIKRRQHLERILPEARLAAQSEEARKRRKESLARIKHSQGEANSQYGTKWVTNGEINKKIKKEDPAPEGYRPGRKMKTNTRSSDSF
jgi:hypothetical protein